MLTDHRLASFPSLSTDALTLAHCVHRRFFSHLIDLRFAARLILMQMFTFLQNMTGPDHAFLRRSVATLFERCPPFASGHRFPTFGPSLPRLSDVHSPYGPLTCRRCSLCKTRIAPSLSFPADSPQSATPLRILRQETRLTANSRPTHGQSRIGAVCAGGSSPAPAHHFTFPVHYITYNRPTQSMEIACPRK